jgi:tetratricopeptide (TPR) repeat protein
MSEASYIANLNTAVAYLKMGKRDQARDSLKRAFSQVPEDEKKSDNLSYVKILSYTAAIAIGDEDYAKAAKYVEEGLSLKEGHADLLFMRLLVLRHRGAYNAMFPDVLKYLIACSSAEDRTIYEYGFTTPELIKQVMDEILPPAYENSADHEAYMAAVTRFVENTGSPFLKMAHEIMTNIDKTH